MFLFKIGEIFLTILENVGAAVFPPKFSKNSFVFLLGSSNKTNAIYLGLFIGNVPINDVITFFSEYSPFSSFLEVPVLPPTVNPLTFAFFPVPLSTIFLSKLFTFL